MCEPCLNHDEFKNLVRYLKQLKIENVVDKVIDCERRFVDGNTILNYETDFIDAVFAKTFCTDEPFLSPAIVKVCRAVASGKEDRLKPTLRRAMKVWEDMDKVELLQSVLGL